MGVYQNSVGNKIGNNFGKYVFNCHFGSWHISQYFNSLQEVTVATSYENKTSLKCTPPRTFSIEIGVSNSCKQVKIAIGIISSTLFCPSKVSIIFLNNNPKFYYNLVYTYREQTLTRNILNKYKSNCLNTKYIYLKQSVTKYAYLIGPLRESISLTRPSALRKHLPKVLLKQVVRKEVGNARLLATMPFV